VWVNVVGFMDRLLKFPEGWLLHWVGALKEVPEHFWGLLAHRACAVVGLLVHVGCAKD